MQLISMENTLVEMKLEKFENVRINNVEFKLLLWFCHICEYIEVT